MSTQTIAARTPRARISHQCDWCPEVTRPGQKYGRWTTVAEGRAATVKLCDLCHEFAIDFVDAYGNDEFTKGNATDWAIDFYGPDDSAYWFLVRTWW